MTNTSTLEILSYLTDSTFMSVATLTFAVFIALEAINHIGGRR